MIFENKLKLPIILIIIIIIIYLILRIFKKTQKDKIIKLLNNKIFLFFVPVIIFFTLYIFIFNKINEDDSDEIKKNKIKIKEALKHALIAFVIAICAYFDMLILPFFIIFIISYLYDIDG